MLIRTPRRWTSIDLRSASLFVRRLLDDDLPPVVLVNPAEYAQTS